MKLETLEEVQDHMRRNRDELSQCILGFSGGKEASLLRWLVQRVLGSDLPMVYASCPGVEWPEHLAFIRGRGVEVFATKHDREWWEKNANWAFLCRDSKSANRFARQHQRGTIRRIARTRGKTLLWGNRRKDGNYVPTHRYRATDGTELWMPLRDLPNDAIDALPASERSPMYRYASVKKSGYPTGRIRCTPELRLADAHSHLDPDTLQWFQALYERTQGAPF